MEIKVYTIKLNPPRWLRSVIVYGLLPLGALVGATAAVRAAVTLTTFSASTPIKAADVNANFKNLGDAVTALQTQANAVTTKVSVRDVDMFSATGALTTIQYKTETLDTLNEYDPTTGRFTATNAGDYLVCAGLFTFTPDFEIDVSINGTRTQIIAVSSAAPDPRQPPTMSTYHAASGCGVFRLTKTQYIEVQVSAFTTQPSVPFPAESDGLLDWLQISRLP